MDKPSDARNFPRLPVTYSDLDIGPSAFGRGFDSEFRDLKIWVSGVKARGYIDHVYSARIRILFEEPQSLFRDQEFSTKYFDFNAPGHLVWGLQSENLWILEHRE